MSAVSVFAEGLDHPEGVTIGIDGAVYAGGEAGQIYRIDPNDRSVEQIASTGGFLLGLCSDADGQLCCCDVAKKEVVRLSGGRLDVYSTGTASRRMVNPNWPVFDDEGNLYVTDSGHWRQNDGCVFRVNNQGTTEVWFEGSTNFPNGACLTAAGDALLVLESCTPALVRIPITPDGRAGKREVIAELPGTIPDGVTIDTQGNAYVCCYRPDRILKVSAEGHVEILADDPEGTALSAPTNAVWLHGDLLTGNLGRWHLSLVRVGTEGVPLRYPRVRGGP